MLSWCSAVAWRSSPIWTAPSWESPSCPWRPKRAIPNLLRALSAGMQIAFLKCMLMRYNQRAPVVDRTCDECLSKNLQRFSQKPIGLGWIVTSCVSACSAFFLGYTLTNVAGETRPSHTIILCMLSCWLHCNAGHADMRKFPCSWISGRQVFIQGCAGSGRVDMVSLHHAHSSRSTVPSVGAAAHALSDRRWGGYGTPASQPLLL